MQSIDDPTDNVTNNKKPRYNQGELYNTDTYSHIKDVDNLLREFTNKNTF